MSDLHSIMAGAAFVKFSLENAQFEKGLKKSQSSLQNFMSELGKMSAKASFALYMISKPFSTVINGFAEFDLKMRQVKGITNATATSMERLTEHARKLGRETSFTAKQVADMMIVLGRMGFKTTEIEHATEAVMGLARATGEDMPLAAHVAGNNLKVFKKDASQMGEVSDMILTVVNGSAQGLQDFADAASKAGPQFMAAGMDMKEMAASIGVLANMGIKGSIAGTSLRTMITRMSNRDIQSRLATFGVTIEDLATNKIRPFSHILRDFASAMSVLGDSEKISLISELFGERGTMGVMPIIGNVNEIDDMLEKLEDVEGTVKRNSKEIEGGLFGAIKHAESAVQDLNIEFGKMLESTIIPLLKQFNWLVSSALKMMKDNIPQVLAAFKAFAYIGAGSGIIALIKYTKKGLDVLLGPMKVINDYLLGNKTTMEKTAEIQNKMAVQRQREANAVSVQNKQENLDNANANLENARNASEASKKEYKEFHKQIDDNNEKIKQKNNEAEKQRQEYLDRQSNRLDKINEYDSKNVEDENKKREIRKEITDREKELRAKKKEEELIQKKADKADLAYNTAVSNRSANDRNRTAREDIEREISKKNDDITVSRESQKQLSDERKKEKRLLEEDTQKLDGIERERKRQAKVESDIENIKNENIKLYNKTSDNKKELAVVDNEINSLQERSKALDVQESELKKVSKDTKAKAGNIKGELEKVNKELDSITIESEDEVKRAISDSGHKLGGYTTSNKALKRKRKGISAHRTQAGNKLNKLKKQMENLNDENAGLESSRSKLLAMKENGTATSGTNDALNVVNSKIRENKINRDLLETKIKDAQSSYDSYNKSIKEIDGKISDSEANIQSAKEELSKNNARRIKREADLVRKTTLTQRKESLESQLPDLEEKHSKAFIAWKKAREEKENVKENLSDKNSEKKRLERTIRVAEKKINDNGETLKGLVDVYNNDFKNLDDAEKTIKESIDKREKKITDINNKIDDEKFKVENARSEITTLNNKKNRIPRVKSAGVMDKEVAEAKVVLDSANKELDDAKSNSREAVNILDMAKSKMNTLESQMGERNAKKESLLSEGQKDKMEMEKSNSEIKGQIDSIKQSNSLLAERDKELKRIAEENEKQAKRMAIIQSKAQMDYEKEQRRANEYVDSVKKMGLGKVQTQEYKDYEDSRAEKFFAKKNLESVKKESERLIEIKNRSNEQMLIEEKTYAENSIRMAKEMENSKLAIAKNAEEQRQAIAKLNFARSTQNNVEQALKDKIESERAELAKVTSELESINKDIDKLENSRSRKNARRKKKRTIDRLESKKAELSSSISNNSKILKDTINSNSKIISQEATRLSILRGTEKTLKGVLASQEAELEQSQRSLHLAQTKARVSAHVSDAYGSKVTAATNSYEKAVINSTHAMKKAFNASDRLGMATANYIKNGRGAIRVALNHAGALSKMSIESLYAALNLYDLEKTGTKVTFTMKAMNMATALFTKGLAYLKIAMKGVMTFIKSNWLLILPFLISYVFEKLNSITEEAVRKSENAVNEIIKQREKLNEKNRENASNRKEMLEGIQLLKILEDQGKMTNQQQEEAIKIINKLTSQYGLFNIQIDKNTNSIKGAYDALNDFMNLSKEKTLNETKDYLNKSIDASKGKAKTFIREVFNEGLDDDTKSIMEASGFSYEKTGEMEQSLNGSPVVGLSVKVPVFKYINKEIESIEKLSIKELQNLMKKLEAGRQKASELGKSEIEKRISSLIDELGIVKKTKQKIDDINNPNAINTLKDLVEKPDQSSVESANKEFEKDNERLQKQRLNEIEKEIYEKRKEQEERKKNYEIIEKQKISNLKEAEANLNDKTKQRTPLQWKTLNDARNKARKELYDFNVSKNRNLFEGDLEIRKLVDRKNFLRNRPETNATIDSINNENRKNSISKSAYQKYEITQKAEEDYNRIQDELNKKKLDYRANQIRIDYYKKNGGDYSELESENNKLSETIQSLEKTFSETRDRYYKLVMELQRDIKIEKQFNNKKYLEELNAPNQREKEYSEEQRKERFNNDISKLIDNGKYKVALNKVNQEIYYSNRERLIAKRQYQNLVNEAKKAGFYDYDNKLSDSQKKLIETTLREADERTRQKENLQMNLIGKRQEIQEGMENAKRENQSSRSVGSYSSAGLSRMLSMDSYEQRIANATEKSNVQLSSINSTVSRALNRNNADREQGIRLN